MLLLYSILFSTIVESPMFFKAEMDGNRIGLLDKVLVSGATFAVTFIASKVFEFDNDVSLAFGVGLALISLYMLPGKNQYSCTMIGGLDHPEMQQALGHFGL